MCARHEDVKQDPTTPDNLRVVDASHTFNKRCNHMTNAFILVYMVYIKGCTDGMLQFIANRVLMRKMLHSIQSHTDSNNCQADCATCILHHLEQELDKTQLICGDDHTSSVAHGRHWQLQLCLFIPLCMHTPLPRDKLPWHASQHIMH